MSEIWAPVRGFVETYEVSTYGRVRRNSSGRMLKLYEDRHPRTIVTLNDAASRKRRTVQVAREVYAAFGPTELSEDVRVFRVQGRSCAIENLVTARQCRDDSAFRAQVLGTQHSHPTMEAAAEYMGMTLLAFQRVFGRLMWDRLKESAT